MVRYLVRQAHRTKEDRIMATNLCLPVFGQHVTMPGIIIIAGKIKVIKMQVDVKSGSSGRERAQPFRHDFSANAIASDYSNVESVFGHF